MRKFNQLTVILLLMFTISSFTGCSGKNDKSYNKTISKGLDDWVYNSSDEIESSILVNKINGLNNDFIRGVDASSVIAQENSGVVYRDFNGQEQDIFTTFKESGVNYIRVRLWNDPFDSNGNSYGGGANDLSTAIKIGKRATANGLKLLVDFHYSDFWADPKKQLVPKAWKDMDIDTKNRALYSFTKECLESMIKEGIDIGMVQIGNETTEMMCGETDWIQITKLMNSGCSAVRDVDNSILIAIHFTNSENYAYYASVLNSFKVDYDIFACSYYPFWHGTLENLSPILTTIANEYKKKIMVAETSYAYTYEDGDNFANSIGEGGTFTKKYQFTVQGQAEAVYDVIKTIHGLGDSGIGVFYWEPAWIPVPGNSYDERSVLWEKHGSGWASSFAAEYDPDDAGMWYGGSSWDNQAMFDWEGNPLESLKIFGYIYTGTKLDNNQ